MEPLAYLRSKVLLTNEERDSLNESVAGRYFIGEPKWFEGYWKPSNMEKVSDGSWYIPLSGEVLQGDIDSLAEKGLEFISRDDFESMQVSKKLAKTGLLRNHVDAPDSLGRAMKESNEEIKKRFREMH